MEELKLIDDENSSVTDNKEYKIELVSTNQSSSESDESNNKQQSEINEKPKLMTRRQLVDPFGSDEEEDGEQKTTDNQIQTNDDSIELPKSAQVKFSLQFFILFCKFFTFEFYFAYFCTYCQFILFLILFFYFACLLCDIACCSI